MIIIYTGCGKGKTTASVGQAIRAYGQGMIVAFGQFMKRPNRAGEQKVLAELLGERFFACGKGFLRNEEDRPAHRRAALTLLAWAEKQAETVEMLVLDEALYALAAGIMEQKELRALIQQARLRPFHLVLSGRGAPEWLPAEADIVTEMGVVKHVYDNGAAAQRGIEF